MNIYGPIRQLLTDDATVTGLVGSRIYSEVIEQQATLPAVVMRVVDVMPATHKTGVSSVDTIPLQVDVYAKNGGMSGIKLVEQISEAVRQAIDRFAGTVTVSGDDYQIQGMHFTGIVPLPFDVEDDVYRRGNLFKIRLIR